MLLFWPTKSKVGLFQIGSDPSSADQRWIQAVWLRSSQMCEQTRVCGLAGCSFGMWSYFASWAAHMCFFFFVGLLNSALVIVRPVVVVG